MKNELRLEGAVNKERVSLSGIDLSYRNITSAPLGMLVPTMVQEVVGKQKVRIGLESQTRCRPLVVPSFIRLREHFDYFFVPFSQLWHPYDNFKTMQGNYNSTLVDAFQSSSIPNKIPSVPMNNLATSIIDAADNDLFDVAGYGLHFGMMRLMDSLGYGINPAMYKDTSLIYLPSDLRVNVFRALAYQKIYSDYYRNDKYEGNYVEHYNIDDVLDFSDTPADNDARIQKFFEPHYRWRKKDYFTSVWPNDMPNNLLFGFEGFQAVFQFGVQSGQNSTFNVAGMPSNSGNQQNFVRNGFTGNTTDITDKTAVTPTSGASTSSVNILNSQQTQSQHRLLAAQERYLRRLYAAKQNFPSIMEAIFGYSPKIGRNGSVSHLGGVCNLISVSDVNNTAQPSIDSPAGKINSYNSGNKIVNNFEVPEDGIIMCIYSTSVENDYRSNRLDRNNVKRFPEEMFNPNYVRLGRQPLFGFEYNFVVNRQVATSVNTRLLGYQKRYAEYLTHVDEVHGAFCTAAFSPYSAFMNDSILDSKPLTLTQLIINPAIMRDIISGGRYDGNLEGDHFYLNIYNKVESLTPIEVSEDY